MTSPTFRKKVFACIAIVSIIANVYVLNKFDMFKLRSYQVTNVTETQSAVRVISMPSANDSLQVSTEASFFTPVAKFNFSGYKIYPANDCRHGNVVLVMCIPSGRDHFESRMAVRNSWGQYGRANNTNGALLIFFVGSEPETQPPSQVQEKLNAEALKFGDILQDNYTDVYRNLSFKTLSILKWVITFCPSSQFVLKADDDMYMNVPLLFDLLKTSAKARGENASFILGQAARNGQPIRDSNSKWYASFKEYTDTHYPEFVFGPSYSMTTSAARKLYEASLVVPFFWLEDVYVTGLCSRKAGVPIIHSGQFSNYRLPVSGCVFRNHISGHAFYPSEITKIHSELYNSTIKC